MWNLPKQMTRIVCTVAVSLGAFFGPAASGQTQADGLIIRNERVGPVRLGMTAGEVIVVLGQPRQSGFLTDQHGYLNYCDGECSWPRRRLVVLTWGPRNEVFGITVQPEAREYATPEGVTIGMSEMDVRIRLGNPSQRIWDESAGSGFWRLLYPGLEIVIEGGGVVSMTICSPRYQRRGRAGQTWCA
jgi:hypothetical protein